MDSDPFDSGPEARIGVTLRISTLSVAPSIARSPALDQRVKVLNFHRKRNYPP